jgi:hypothetical protein
MHIRSLSALLIGVLLLSTYPTKIHAQSNAQQLNRATQTEIQHLQEKIAELKIQLEKLNRTPTQRLLVKLPKAKKTATVPVVPFYSQFKDISDSSWQKVSCGIAGIAMLIDYYSDEIIIPDTLLARGIARNAFLSDAGWIHSGLIGLSRDYGLEGKSVSFAHLNKAGALAELATELRKGPVLASVHYTFEPTNPIPHLVVINAIKDGLVYYNDPAESAGGGTLTVEKFQSAWKQRFIVVRPT